MGLEAFSTLHPYWLWLVGGAVLLMLELLAPGVFLLWLGIAALLVGAAELYTGLDIPAQFALFGILSVALGVFARVILRYGVSVSDRGVLNKAGNRLLGQVFTVAEPIVNGRGKVKVGDTLWNAAGPDAAAGSNVRVVGSKGALLMVEAAL
jgi:inner membrane protein